VIAASGGPSFRIAVVVFGTIACLAWFAFGNVWSDKPRCCVRKISAYEAALYMQDLFQRRVELERELAHAIATSRGTSSNPGLVRSQVDYRREDLRHNACELSRMWRILRGESADFSGRRAIFDRVCSGATTRLTKHEIEACTNDPVCLELRR
jgi:hypothetical protein